MLKNTTTTYGWVSITLHWLMAVVMFGMFGLGVYMVDLTYVNAWYRSAPFVHQSVGLLLFMLLLFRLFWRLMNPLPVIFGQGFEKVIALLVHRMHYVFMFTVMLSGYLITTADGRGIDVFHWFEVPALLPPEKGREDVAGLVHMWSAYAFMGFVLLHAAAAMKHHFVDKDATLLRMLGKNSKKGEE